MGLYENMNLLRKIAERLDCGKHTVEDIKYLAHVLKDIVDGCDAHASFSINIKQKGVKRTDYRKHLNIARAFHMIMGAMGSTYFELGADGKYYETNNPIKGMQLTQAIRTAAHAFNINPSSLMRYWNQPNYQGLKNEISTSLY